MRPEPEVQATQVIPPVSAIVRTKDKADTLPATIASLRAQSVNVQVIVVDSGSTDSTLAIAGALADEVVEVAPFTYGRALNRGAAAASAPVHVALSAHCVLPDAGWLSRTLRHYETSDVAATNGATIGPDAMPLDDVYFQTGRDPWALPIWGFSNHASSWRAQVWQAHPFREDLAACEDREWAHRVTTVGWRIAYDPSLVVDTGHRRGAGLSALWRRVFVEAEALGQLGAPPVSSWDALHDWWHDFPYDSRIPKPLRRLGPSRTVELVGRWAGSRAGHRGAHRSGSVHA